jgi:ClpP class serine protease
MTCRISKPVFVASGHALVPAEYFGPSRGGRSRAPRLPPVHHQHVSARRLAAAEALAEKLSTGTWTHDYPIFASTARELGLAASTDMPDEVLELMSLYPQPVRAQSGGGVEYLPVPRQKEPAPAATRIQ